MPSEMAKTPTSAPEPMSMTFLAIALRSRLMITFFAPKKYLRKNNTLTHKNIAVKATSEKKLTMIPLKLAPISPPKPTKSPSLTLRLFFL